MDEVELTQGASIMDASDTGNWIVVVSQVDDQTYVKGFSYESPTGSTSVPALIWSENRNPVCIAIQEGNKSQEHPMCRLAFSEVVREAALSIPIQIVDINILGESRA